MPYHKTTVEIDTDALATAEEVLGTRGIKETVNRALEDVARRAALKRAAALFLAGEIHLPDEETWSRWREPRTM